MANNNIKTHNLPTQLARPKGFSVSGQGFSINGCVWLLLGLCGLMALSEVQAVGIDWAAGIRVCEVDAPPDNGTQPPPNSDPAMPDFSDAHCTSAQHIDPQWRLIWVELLLTDGVTDGGEPLGLILSGKAATQAHLNGRYLGHNGVPASVQTQEVAGQIDAVIHLPHEFFRPHDNRLQLLMSAHQGFLTLGHPMQFIGIGPYQNPTDGIFRHYWASLVPFGVLLFGVFYWGCWAWLNRPAWPQLSLLLMTGFVAMQLVVEVARGLVAYPYPWHDARLLALVLCSFGFGLALLVHVTQVLNMSWRWLIWPVLVMVVVALWVPSFDLKTALVIAVPTLTSLCVALGHWRSKPGPAKFLFSVLLLFVVTLLALGQSQFIDIYYYYLVAGLLLALMAQQLIEFKQAQAQQQADRARANQLQLIIDQQAYQQEDASLRVSSAGSVQQVKIKGIAYCQGAGDYVELVGVNGEVILHHATLAELATALPSVFLKTHRSYLVNTHLIQTLNRLPSGVGELVLNTGQTVPVSRRILPQVRAQITEAP